MHNSTICTICLAAKQSRKSFPSSFIKTTKPFQLIYLDVWGPYKHTTYDGCSYFLTIVDDYTRATWVYLMKEKNQSISFIQHFYAYVETHFQCQIQTIRSDNARELCEGDALKFFLTKGIHHQKSCVDTP